MCFLCCSMVLKSGRFIPHFFSPFSLFVHFRLFYTIFGFLLNEFGKETCVWWLGGKLGGSKHMGGKRKWNWTEVNKHQAEVHSLGPRTTPGTLYEVSHTHFTAPWDTIWCLTHTFYCRHFGRIIPLYTTVGRRSSGLLVWRVLIHFLSLPILWCLRAFPWPSSLCQVPWLCPPRISCFSLHSTLRTDLLGLFWRPHKDVMTCAVHTTLARNFRLPSVTSRTSAA